MIFHSPSSRRGRDRQGFHGRATDPLHAAIVCLSAHMLPNFAMNIIDPTIQGGFRGVAFWCAIFCPLLIMEKQISCRITNKNSGNQYREAPFRGTATWVTRNMRIKPTVVVVLAQKCPNLFIFQLFSQVHQEFG